VEIRGNSLRGDGSYRLPVEHFLDRLGCHKS
jgi:hypothetical protein